MQLHFFRSQNIDLTSMPGPSRTKETVLLEANDGETTSATETASETGESHFEVNEAPLSSIKMGITKR